MVFCNKSILHISALDRNKGYFYRSTLILIFLLFLVSSCSTTKGVKHDPFEPMNRAIYKFNEVVDDILLKPIAKTYKAVTPDPVETGVSNFFNNVSEPTGSPVSRYDSITLLKTCLDLSLKSKYKVLDI